MKNNFTEHVTISKEQLMAHENNPRKDIGDISELTQSIKKNGIMQNLTVMPAEDNDKFDPKTDKFVILIGHRRFEAGKKAGVKYFPCNIVTGLSEREQLSIMLEENMQRTDLTILEQARGFQMMLDLGETPDSISKKTGFSKSTVRHRLNIAKPDEGIIKDKEDKSFQLTIMDFCELEKIKDVERRNELLKEASDSANLKWIIKREVNNENIRKNKEKVLNILKKMGLTEAPEDIAKNIYRNNIKRIESLYIDADSDTEIPEMELSGDCYYHENGSCITVVRKKTDEELKQEKSAGSQPELSVHAKLANIEKKMKDERTAFIKSILDSDIKEDVRDRLWSMIINGKTCVSYKSIIVFLAGKEFAKIKATDRDEYKAKAESLDTVKQMLCVIEQETGMNITNWYDQYDSDNAKKVIEFTDILEKFGFSYEDDDEYKVLLGTHELFAKDEDSEDGDTEEIEVSDIAEDSDIPDTSDVVEYSDIPEISEDVEISGEADDTVEADIDAYADVTDEAVAEDVSIAA